MKTIESLYYALFWLFVASIVISIIVLLPAVFVLAPTGRALIHLDLEL